MFLMWSRNSDKNNFTNLSDHVQTGKILKLLNVRSLRDKQKFRIRQCEMFPFNKLTARVYE